MGDNEHLFAGLPAWCRSVMPLAFLSLALTLRLVHDTADSAIDALMLLPFCWIALRRSRRQLWVAGVLVVIAFVGPVLVAEPGSHGNAGWQSAVLWLATCAVLGSWINRVVGEVATAGEQSERERAQLAGLLAAATSYLIVGTDPDGLITVFNGGAERMLGYRAEDVIGKLRPSVLHVPAEMDALVTEMGCEPGPDGVIRAIRQGFKDKRECTYVRQDGSHVPVELTVSEVRDASGATVGSMGIAADISARLQVQRELAVSEENLRLVARAARGLSTDKNARHEICEAARAIARADFVQLWEPVDGTHLHVTACTGAEEPGELRLECADGTSGVASAYSRCQRGTVADAAAASACESLGLGELVEVSSVLYEPVLGHDGALGVLVVVWATTITDDHHHEVEAIGLLAAEAAVAIERSDQTKELASLARTDALTGLANRRVWDEDLPRALLEATRSGRPVCVALIDLDHFKAFNDSYGHPAGDRLLRTAAAAWHACLRQTDVLVRYGGEEFAVILPDANLGAAERILDRLRTATPEAQTCSIGVAEWDRVESAEAFLGRADDRVYDAKRAGRDRVVTAAVM